MSISTSTPSNEASSSRNAAAHTPPNTCWSDLRSPLAPGRITFFPLIVDRDESVSSNESVENVDSNNASFVGTATNKGNNVESSNSSRGSKRSNSFSSCSSSIGQKIEHRGNNNSSFFSSSSSGIMRTRNSFPSSMPSLLQERLQRNGSNGEGEKDAREKIVKIFHRGLKRSQSTGNYPLQYHHSLNLNNRNMEVQKLLDSDTKAAHVPYNGESREAEDEKYRR
mmetsp:Transcript_24231/g.33875  ORF Transcript_24231/g.33875 Transcript_24231/m.33875 type:complete len:224 (+) Transcript_24231:83-754(+)